MSKLKILKDVLIAAMSRLDMNSTNRRECIGPKLVQLFTMTSLLKCNQRVGYLLCSMAKIYDIWDGSLDKRKVTGLVPCYGQDGYRAQVLQQPIVTKH